MEPSANPPPAASPPSWLTTWPRSVQFALAVLLVAGLFFPCSAAGRARSQPLGQNAPAPPAADLNRATRAELRLLPGVGDALAQRIVDHRQRNGSFRNVDDLRQVSGVRPEDARPLAARSLRGCVDDPTPMSEPSAPSAAAKPKTSTASKKLADLTQPININRAPIKRSCKSSPALAPSCRNASPRRARQGTLQIDRRTSPRSRYRREDLGKTAAVCHNAKMCGGPWRPRIASKPPCLTFSARLNPRALNGKPSDSIP